MKNKQGLPTKKFKILLFAFGLILLTACENSNRPESLEIKVLSAQEQNPEQYKRYTDNLKNYKKSKHLLLCASFENAPKISTNEGDFLRSLPDSLDIVWLSNAENLSQADKEDMKVLQSEKGTKILYQFNYMQQLKTDFANAEGAVDLQKLASYLEQIVAKVKSEGFDGINLNYSGSLGRESAAAKAEKEAVEQIFIEKLTTALGPKAKNGTLLLFEGNPGFISSQHQGSFDYFVLDTSEAISTYDWAASIEYGHKFAGIPTNKLLLSARPASPDGNESGLIKNKNGLAQNAIVEAAKAAISFGPLAGIAIVKINRDYYDPKINYNITREAMSILNPSPAK